MTLSNCIVEFFEKLSAWEDKTVQGTGISLPNMHTIEILGIFGELRMKELASKIGVTTGTLTITVDKLEKKGFVKRVPNPLDRRSYLIALTDKGYKVHRAHAKAHLDMTTESLKEFSETEKEQFLHLLTKFKGNIPL